MQIDFTSPSDSSGFIKIRGIDFQYSKHKHKLSKIDCVVYYNKKQKSHLIEKWDNQKNVELYLQFSY